MKIKENFLVHRSGEHCVMVAAGDSPFHGMIRLNRTAEFIVSCLREETTEEAVVDAVFGKYDAPRELIEKNVSDVLAKLRSVGALDE